MELTLSRPGCAEPDQLYGFFDAKLFAKKVPMSIYHGAKDDVVKPQLSLAMVNAILEAGGTPNFTLYAKDNHNSWDSTFAETELLSWLFSNTKLKNE